MKTQTATEPVMTLPEAMAEIERLNASSARYLGRVAELVLEREELRDFAYNRAPKQAAEDCERQKAELRAQLEDEQARRSAAERELAGRPMARCANTDCHSASDGADYWFCRSCFEREQETAERVIAFKDKVITLLETRAENAESLAERYRLALEGIQEELHDEKNALYANDSYVNGIDCALGLIAAALEQLNEQSCRAPGEQGETL